MKHPNKNRTTMKTTSPQQKESGSPDKASKATQYKEYISKRNQNILTFQKRNLKEKSEAKTIHGTCVSQGNELVFKKPEGGSSKPRACKCKDVAGPQSEKPEKPDTSSLKISLTTRTSITMTSLEFGRMMPWTTFQTRVKLLRY